MTLYVIYLEKSRGAIDKKSYIDDKTMKGDRGVSRAYFSELTEKQKKEYIIKLLEAYPQCEKNVRSFLKIIQDKCEHYKEYVEDKNFSIAVQYEICEEEFLHLRKEVNKIFAVFTNDLKRILVEIQDDPYFQDCYLKAQELNQRATLYRKEVRKKLGDYKRMYHLYRIDLRGSIQNTDFMDIAKLDPYKK